VWMQLKCATQQVLLRYSKAGNKNVLKPFWLKVALQRPTAIPL
jgi:hypothetical protein